MIPVAFTRRESQVRNLSRPPRKTGLFAACNPARWGAQKASPTAKSASQTYKQSTVDRLRRLAAIGRTIVEVAGLVFVELICPSPEDPERIDDEDGGPR